MFRTEPLTAEQFDACVSLLKAHPFKPYGHYARQIGDGAIEQLFLTRVRTSIEAEERSALWIPGPDGALALAVWTRLGWDSEQLGYGAGRLDHLVALGKHKQQWGLKEVMLNTVLGDCIRQGIRHLSARGNASDLTTIHLLEQHGFITVDGILTFSLDIQDAHFPTKVEGLDVRLSRPEDVEQIKDIARSSYVHDRFHSDPSIPKEIADSIYAVWMENACLGRVADAVVVAERDGRVLSYVACKVDHQAIEYLGFGIGTIVLVATAAGTRGQGLARATTYGALNWFREHEVKIVEVGTQLRNIPASRLYEACGFELVASSLSLRKWVEDA